MKGVSEFLASLEELGQLNADKRREVEACGTYCCREIVPLTKNLLYEL